MKNRLILIANLHLINSEAHLRFSQTPNRQQLKHVIYFRKKPLAQILNYKSKMKNRFILIANLHLINSEAHLGFSQTPNRKQLKDVICFGKKPLAHIFSYPECVPDTTLKYVMYPKIRMRKPCKTLSHDFIPFET